MDGNFIIKFNYEQLSHEIERHCHDYRQCGEIVTTKHKSIDNLIKQYPSKEALNNKYFGGK
jgi:hypothetical protein